MAEQGGRVAGTVTTIAYENRFAWIGVVLVGTQFRRKDIGTALLLKAIDYLDARQWSFSVLLRCPDRHFSLLPTCRGLLD